MQKDQGSSSKIPLEMLLNLNFRQNIIKVIERNGKKLVKGIAGHNSFFFKKPVIQGKFYLEMIGHKPKQLSNEYRELPRIRVGVAPTQYYYNYPLGQLFSIAYKMDGRVYQQKEQKTFLQPYNFGDVIGIGLTINSIHKNRDKQKKDYQNFVQFFKNGKRVGAQLRLLTQDLFTFSGSLFNQSEIQVNYEEQTIKYLPNGYHPYAIHLTQRCQYRNDVELVTCENEILKLLSNL